MPVHGQSFASSDRRPIARIRDWAGALGEVAQSGSLHRAQISFAAMWASESAFMVSLAVVAYGDGGVARSASSPRPAWRPLRFSRRSLRRWPTGFVASGF